MDEIGLQDFIYQVKRELLAVNQAQRATDPNPLFLVEKVELEVAVKATRTKEGGIKLSVLDMAELSAGTGQSREHLHVARISLAPLFSREELLAELQQDVQALASVQRDSVRAFLKSGEGGVVGAPE